MNDLRKLFLLTVILIVYSSQSFAGFCGPEQPGGFELTPKGIQVERNGFNENHPEPNCRIKLDYLDQAAAVQVRRWASLGKSEAQVMAALKKMKVIMRSDDGIFQTQSWGTLGNISYSITQITVAGNSGNAAFCFSGDDSSKPLIHEWDHSLGFAFGLNYWTRIGPGHSTNINVPDSWNGPGLNINGTAMQPYTPQPKYENYCVTATPQQPPQATTSNDNWGTAGDIPFTGKFFSTDKEDIGVFRPSNSTFYLKKYGSAETKSLSFGQAGDIPFTGDFFGTGYSQIAVFRPGNGVWYFMDHITGRFEAQQWGMAGDIPVPGDFFGTGRMDMAVFRPSDGHVYIRNIQSAEMKIFGWGANGDKPVAGKFLGLARDQIAQYRPSTGTWYILDPDTGRTEFRQYGAATDIPLAGKLSSQASDDIIMFRPSNGVYYSLNVLTGATGALQWGQAGDVPLAGKLVSTASGKDNYVIFRNGAWWVFH
ncbi:MAG TPA: hypothetical protein VNJ01_03110 [Bacteriovoracaceae bacterium]|nr:hypothetical protein [Bacteriovoracaceae bacterium]